MLARHPATRPLVWDDMLRAIPEDQLSGRQVHPPGLWCRERGGEQLAAGGGLWDPCPKAFSPGDSLRATLQTFSHETAIPPEGICESYRSAEC